MTKSMRTVIVFVMLAQGLAGCDGANPVPTPTSPSPVEQPAPPPVPQPVPSPATVRLAGFVSDTAWRPLAGARVEVVDGPEAGQSSTSDSTGAFELGGTFDATTHFRATKEGYSATTKPLPSRCAACNPHWWIYFSLESVDPPVDIAGDYTLTFIADSVCADLPNDVRTRTYLATIPSGSSPDVTVAGARFVQNLAYGYFEIGIAADYLSVSLGDLHGHPGLVEQVADNTYLAFGGQAAASVGSGVPPISMSFDGFIDYCAMSSEMVGPSYQCVPSRTVAHTRCESANHQLILTRR